MSDQHGRERVLTEIEVARRNPRLLIERHFRVRTKDRQLVPLRFNAVQRFYDAGRTDRDCLLKGRQLGISTQQCAYMLAECLLHPNTSCMIATQDTATAEVLLGAVRVMWEHLPEAWHRHCPTRFANRDELFWPTMNSHFLIGSAGTPSLGRGLTLTHLVCDEFAHWPRPGETFAGLTEAVTPGGRIVVASTPRGLNHFHDLWTGAVRGENGFKPSFFPWWLDEDYRVAGPPLDDLTPDEAALCTHFGLSHDQVRWRRDKRRLLRDRFVEEYPEDPTTAFLASGRCCFSVPELVAMRERARQCPSFRVNSLPLYRWCYGGKRLLGEITISPGRLEVWSEPQAGHEYVIGADVSDGGPGGDYCAAFVLDRRGTQAAELHGIWRADVFGRLLGALGAWYRAPMLAVERNGVGGITLQVLVGELRYPRFYATGSRRRGEEVRLGWQTTTRTKPLMVGGMAAAIEDHAITFMSPTLIDEALTFVHTDSGTQQAEVGRHDDLIVAAMIGWQARLQPVARYSRERPPGM